MFNTLARMAGFPMSDSMEDPDYCQHGINIVQGKCIHCSAILKKIAEDWAEGNAPDEDGEE